MSIFGAGGGGGGKGGGSSRKAKEAKDNLDSTAYAKIIELLSEGEIEGFATPSKLGLTPGSAAYMNAAMKDVFFNNTPLLRVGASNTAPQDSDFNFQSVSFVYRLGTQGQSYVPGFDAVESEQSVNVVVAEGLPVTRTVSNPDVDAVRITLSVPVLQRIQKDGDIKGSSIDLRIEVSYNGAGFVTAINDTIAGRTNDLYQRDYVINLDGDFPVDIRVTKLTPDSTSATLSNDLSWFSYTELIYQKLRYPNTAYAALRLDAEQFSSIPSRSYRIRGIKVSIPSNATVDIQTGRLTYSGVWNGTFAAAAWTSDPAWILWDLITSDRYGLGDHIQAEKLDKWAFYRASQYCNELVSTGLNSPSTEPRFSCNINIQTQEEAYKVINDLCSVFRAMPFWSAGALTVAQDRPADAVARFNLSNVTEEGFNYEGSSLKGRATVVIVSWLNLELGDIDREIVEDADGIARYGVVTKEISAFACTSRSQARRIGEWLLYTERYETEVVTFTTGLENGIILRPGSIIEIADPVKSGVRRGGRISSATTTAITVDNDFGSLPVEVTNLILYSESFAAVDSTSLNNVTVVNDVINAPNGTLTADSITGSSAVSNVKYWYKSIVSIPGLTYTASVYLKAGTQTTVLVRMNDQTGVNDVQQAFNLSTGAKVGSVVNLGTTTNPTSEITAVGDGWYRCAVSCTFASGVTQVQGPSVFHDGYTVSTSTNTYYAWGAQLEEGTTVGQYVPTTSAPATSITNSAVGSLAEQAQLSVMLPDGISEARTVLSIVNNLITVATPFTTAPQANAAWLLENSEVQPTQWRVLAVQEENGINYTVSAVTYNGSKYAFIERGEPLEERSISLLNQPPPTPIGLVSSEVFYVINGRVATKLSLAWQPVRGVNEYRVRWRGDFTNWAETKVYGPIYEIEDVSNGTYQIEVYAISATQVISSAPAELTVEVEGVTNPPADPTGVSLVPVDESTAIIQWDLATDLDVLVGGEVLIRHDPRDLPIAEWTTSNAIVQAAAGNQTQKQVPLLAGTYFIAFRDQSGNRSLNPVAISAVLPTPQPRLLVKTWAEENETPPFNGISFNLDYDAGLDALFLDPSIDLIGDYVYEETLDLGAVYDVNLRRRIVSSPLAASGLLFDNAPGLFDSFTGDFDGNNPDLTNAITYVRTTTGSPSTATIAILTESGSNLLLEDDSLLLSEATAGGASSWSQWNEYANAIVRARGVQLKVIAQTGSANTGVSISELGATAELQQRSESGNGSGSSGYDVTFGDPFYQTPDIVVSASNMVSGDYYTITSASRTGFRVDFKNSANAAVTRSFSYTAVGYGREI